MARLRRPHQSVGADITDIAVMRAIAPGPVAAPLQHREAFARQQLADPRALVVGREDVDTGKAAALRLRFGIMRREPLPGDGDVGQVAPRSILAVVERP